MRRALKSNVAAGLVTVVLIVVAVYAAFIGKYPWSDPYEITAVFSSAASQIDNKSPVRIAGVEVGKVKKVERGPGTSVLVTMEIKDAGRPIRKDAVAKIRPRLFLEGNFFVDLEPGTPGAAEMKPGGRIPLAQTDIPVQLDEVLATFDSSTRDQLRGVLREYAGALKEGGAEAFSEGVPHWRGAFGGTAQVMQDLRGLEQDDLSRFIAEQAVVSEALADRDRDLAELVTSFRRTVGAFASERSGLSSTLRLAASTLTSARPALREIDAALPTVRAFAIESRPALRAAPETLDLAQPVLREADRLVHPAVLPAFLAEARPLSRQLTALQPPLTKLLDQLDPIVTCVHDKALPVLESDVEDDHLSTGMPVWQELLHFPTGLASASSNFDANGNWIRYHAGGGENLVTTTLPGVGDLLSLAPSVPLGARPRYVRGENPPFRPDVPCETQEVPDLRAEKAPAPGSVRVEPLDALGELPLLGDVLSPLLGLLTPRQRESADVQALQKRLKIDVEPEQSRREMLRDFKRLAKSEAPKR